MEKVMERKSYWDAPSKPKIIRINVVENQQSEEALQVSEYDNTPYSAPIDRSGFYNMTLAYWIKNEFPVWVETAHITVYPKDDEAGVYGLRLS